MADGRGSELTPAHVVVTLTVVLRMGASQGPPPAPPVVSDTAHTASCSPAGLGTSYFLPFLLGRQAGVRERGDIGDPGRVEGLSPGPQMTLDPRNEKIGLIPAVIYRYGLT